MDKLYIAEKKDIGITIANFIWLDKAYAMFPAGSNITNCRYIEKDGICVTWASGHIMAYGKPEDYDPAFAPWNYYPIFPKKLVPFPSKETIKQFNIVQELISKAKLIIHAGDPDREGQLLIDEILVHCNYQGPVDRLLINAKDNQSMKQAFATIESNSKYRTLYEAGVARAQYDWYVGYSLVRAYTQAAKNVGYKETWHIGRVITPTLALVVQREKEIKAFKRQNYYVLKSLFQYNHKTFSLVWQPKEELLDSDGRLLNKATADNIVTTLATQNAIVKEIKKEKSITKPPLPYSMDTLQIEADKKYGISPKEVLAICEDLYLKELTSYPRSDCNYLPNSQLKEAPRILDALESYGINKVARANLSLRSKAWNDKKITAHHAIIPTGVVPQKELDEKTALIFKMICERYLAQFYPPCQFEKTTLIVTIGNEEFKGNGRVITDIGFKEIYGLVDEDSSEEDNNEFPSLKIGESLGKPEKLIVEKKSTSPPKRFTQGTLIQAMTNIHKFMSPDNPNREVIKEIKGIGTPATRDTIITELLLDTKDGRKRTPMLATNSKKELVPTDFGISIIDNVDDYLKLPDHTALMELKLRQIVEASLSYNDFIEEVKSNIVQSVAYTKTHKFSIYSDIPVYRCPLCENGELVQRYSKAIQLHFWICNNEACMKQPNGKPYFFDDNKGEPRIDLCPYCKTPLSKRKGVNGEFWVCSNDKAHTFVDNNNQPVTVQCPDDNAILKRINGKFGLFWSCPSCKRTFNDYNGLPDLEGKSKSNRKNK